MKNPLEDKYRDKMTEPEEPVTVKLGHCRLGEVVSFPSDPGLPCCILWQGQANTRLACYPAIRQSSNYRNHDTEVYRWIPREDPDGSIALHPPEGRGPERVVVGYEDLEPGDVFRQPYFLHPEIKTAKGHLFWLVGQERWAKSAPGAGTVTLMEPIPEEE